jgi:phage tail sheath protein FI
MPEYLAPGVYVEETSFRAKSIEGVSTTTTGFIGPTRYGPLDIEPEIITSLVEFERTYGDRERLVFVNDDDTTTEMDNWMWHAARAFFEEGGKRLFVSRVYSAAGSPPGGFSSEVVGDSPNVLTVRARFPGRAGDARVTFTFNVGQNVLVDTDPTAGVTPGVRSLVDRDVVLIRDLPSGSPPSALNVRGFFLALRDLANRTWNFSATGDENDSPLIALADLVPGATEVRVVTVAVAVDPFAPGAASFTERDLPLDPRHIRAGNPDSLFDAFATHERDPNDPNAKFIANLGRARIVPIVIENTAGLANGVEVLNAFLDDPNADGSPLNLSNAIRDLDGDPASRSLSIIISGGDDGARPSASDYEGAVDPNTDLKTGLQQFEDLEDISIVAAPGSTYGFEDAIYNPQARTIVSLLLTHAERMKYRIAVIDSGDNQSIGQVRAMRAQYDSKYGALYYPWVRVLDPLTQREIYAPPSGFVAGIYARNDINRAVYKAPANEVVNLALGFERFLNKSQQEVLNPEGVNCFRFFEGRGMRLWGARTISSDPEWKYVNLRRYFAYLERSIDKGTQWAVFEPNGEALWANVRRTIEDFLLNEWQNGALLGEKPDKAYFVKCDRSTMTQNDLDNGRLIVLVGVAPLRPAEFVIFRVGQWTADRKV